jgi:nitrogen fixation protein
MLPDGRVLVTGGRGVSGDCVSLQTAEIYDPAAGGWSNTEGMAVGHGIHAAATLPGGRVLVAAGWSQPAAGCGTPTARSEIYAAATGHWTPAADLASPRAAVESAQLADGSLLLAGGLVPTAEDGVAITDTAEVFHVSAGQWVSAGNMSTPRVAQGMVRLADGRILIAGGGSPTGPLSSAEVYTP